MTYNVSIIYRDAHAGSLAKNRASKTEALALISEALDTGLDIYAIGISRADKQGLYQYSLDATLDELHAQNKMLRERLSDVLRVLRPDQLVDME